MKFLKETDVCTSPMEKFFFFLGDLFNQVIEVGFFLLSSFHIRFEPI